MFIVHVISVCGFGTLCVCVCLWLKASKELVGEYIPNVSKENIWIATLCAIVKLVHVQLDKDLI